MSTYSIEQFLNVFNKQSIEIDDYFIRWNSDDKIVITEEKSKFYRSWIGRMLRHLFGLKRKYNHDAFLDVVTQIGQYWQQHQWNPQQQPLTNKILQSRVITQRDTDSRTRQATKALFSQQQETLHSASDEIPSAAITDPASSPVVDTSSSPVVDIDTIPLQEIQLPRGTSQYFYNPASDTFDPNYNANRAVTCSCNAAAAIDVIGNHYAKLLQIIRERHANLSAATAFFASLQQESIRNGTKMYEKIRSSLPNPIPNPEELTQWYPGLYSLQTWTSPAIGVPLEKELSHAFRHPTGKSFHYSIIIADGQTFLLIGLSPHRVLLIDTHKTTMRFIDIARVKRYILTDLGCERNPSYGVSFFHGTKRY